VSCGNEVFPTSVECALEELRAGKFVVVVDDEGRENEGDLVIAAEKVTSKSITFMAKNGSGLICMPSEGARLDELGIPRMVKRGNEKHGTDFAVSIGAKKKISTGISARDRAMTVKTFIDPNTVPDDISMPGHVFPLRARPGGVLERTGHTEAAVDMARLAGFYPAGVICEIMKDDGTMARRPSLIKFCQKHGLRLVTIKDLVKYRLERDCLIEKVVEVELPSRFGKFYLQAFEDTIDRKVHLALIRGKISPKKPVLVRVHSECLTGDILGSLRCDCRDQLEAAISKIGRSHSGVFLYMRQEGRGIGLVNKLKAYALQERGFDTVEANKHLGFDPDLRDYGIGAQILFHLGVRKIKLITNNPRKIVGLSGYGLEVVKRISLEVEPCRTNVNYLRAKKSKLGHILTNV
jgi:3,4-dihydroxy 2-butanone 4-phosphate synthase/GTP cyclohydrolase II